MRCLMRQSGLDVEALAQLCGTLQAGSWLLLLVPPWQSWPQQPDSDSLRWSDCPQPIATPHFIHHLQQQLLADSEVSIWRQGEPLCLAPLPSRPVWLAPQGNPSEEQQAILARLLAAESGIWVLTAARGRGKSTVGGMLMASSPLTCWITGRAELQPTLPASGPQDGPSFGHRMLCYSIVLNMVQRVLAGCWWMRLQLSQDLYCNS